MKTDKHIYYIDEDESDENACVVITELDWNVLSDNIHATNSLWDDFENNRYVEISDTMIYNWKEYLKDNQ